ncbi:MAG: DegV family protein [Sarcina sp.]
MAIKIVTDSTSYIPKEYIEKYDIRVVSLNILMEGTSQRELDVDDEVFYREMEKSTEIPTSSQPSIDEYYRAFEEVVKNGDEVLGIFISSKMSGTYLTGFLIKDMILEEYKDAKIEIVDSLNTTMAMGFSVVNAAKTALEDKKSLLELKKEAEELVSKSDIMFAPGTLKYLKKGGRIGTAAALVGGILKIIPILHVVNGSVEILDKVRTKKKAINRMIEILEVKRSEKGLYDAVVYHILNKEEAVELKDRLKEELNLDCKIMDIGPIVGLHVGPGSIGIAFATEN